MKRKVLNNVEKWLKYQSEKVTYYIKNNCAIASHELPCIILV